MADSVLYYKALVQLSYPDYGGFDCIQEQGRVGNILRAHSSCHALQTHKIHTDATEQQLHDSLHSGVALVRQCGIDEHRLQREAEIVCFEYSLPIANTHSAYPAFFWAASLHAVIAQGSDSCLNSRGRYTETFEAPSMHPHIHELSSSRPVRRF
jgi:hypothetical protein